MKVKTEDLKDNKVKVIVNFTKDEVDTAISNKYKELARKYKFPGFRSGKAPRPVIDNMFGKDGVKAQVTDDLVNNNYPLSIDDANIFPVGQPDFGKDKASIVEEGKAFSFEYKIGVAPKFTLKSYDKVKITMPSSDPTEKEVNVQLEQFAEHYFTYEDADANEKAKEDSTLSLKIEAFDDKDKAVENLTNDNLSYHLGSKFLPDEFEKKLIGSKKNDKFEFSIKMPKPATVYTQALEGKTKNIKFNIKVNSIQIKKLPKIDDEFAKKNMGFESLDQLREQIKNQIMSEKAKMLPLLRENKSLDELAKRLVEDVPKSVCEEKEAQLLQDFFTQLQQAGMTFDQYLAQQNLDADKFKEDLKKQAVDVAKQDAALDAYAEKKGLLATDAEVEAEFKNGDPKNWEKLYADWRRRGEIHVVRQAISRMKAAKDVVENADVIIEGEKQTSAKKPAAKKTTDKNTTEKKQPKKTTKK